MRLYHSPTSPYVRKVEVVLRETGQSDAVERVAGGGSPLDPNPATIRANPLGKVPALEREDGPTLFDSRVICRFLDAKGGGGLYPETRLWQVLTLEALADGILDAALLMVYEARLRDEAARSAAFVEAQWQKIVRALDAAEAHWGAHLAGPFDAGQIALGCALGYLDFRHGDRDWRAGRPALAAWEKKIAARPAMQETVPAG